ncbi:MAG: hypothetical protein ABI193_22595 [Minicystis sp.]
MESESVIEPRLGAHYGTGGFPCVKVSAYVGMERLWSAHGLLTALGLAFHARVAGIRLTVERGIMAEGPTEVCGELARRSGQP